MPKKKTLIHAPKSCGGNYTTEYHEDNIPYLLCDTCGHKIDDWQTWNSQYKDLWRDDSNWKAKKNHLTVLLGYFCAVYENHYGISYTLSLNERGLFRGPEVNVLRRIYAMLNGDPWKVKDYIDFIFARKVQKRKKRITSLSYLAVTDFVHEYKLAAQKAQYVYRSTPLPEKMLKWIHKCAPGVEDCMTLQDFGDLKLLLTHYRSGNFEKTADLTKFVSKLESMGYINQELQIKNWRDQ